ncbi:unnamed protein product [Peronospora destructor]|uniref:RGS domain-containing protein n=1 Tax=Peronospora destructor TaxID=86335 RepID=A0AAV0UXK7_9STRA|nr:unnamed protein product [Peronospora destructor]
MDEMHDAIQDAQYIGAVINSQRGPSAAFYNPSSYELKLFMDRQERALGSDWLSLENLLDMPLGFYFFRCFCNAKEHGGRKLDLLVEVTKFRTLQTSEQRTVKGREIWDMFFGNATSGNDSNAAAGQYGVTMWSPLAREDARRSMPSISSSSTSQGTDCSSTGTSSHNLPLGGPSHSRMSLGCLEDLNIASMKTNGIVFWRKNQSSVTRADIRSIYNVVSMDANALGVGGEVVRRLSAVFKRKPFSLGRESDWRSSLNNFVDGSIALATSATSSIVSTSEVNDLGLEKRMEVLAYDTRSDKRMSVESKASTLTLFDELEACVLCSLERFHLKAFRASAYYKRLITFLFLQEQRVSKDDFSLLRVLGRGGFGMVNGCIKRTSASLYAIKVMNKKMIKKNTRKNCALLSERFWRWFHHLLWCV